MTKDRLDAQQTFASVAPWLFVFLWSTGFIVARYATNDADPMAFLSARLIVASLILAAIAHLSNAPRPTAHESRWSIVVGLGIHATYLGGVFIAIDLGLPSGVGALVVGLHPVITAVAGGAMLGEHLNFRQWGGVILGFTGVVLVVINRLTDDTLNLPVRGDCGVTRHPWYVDRHAHSASALCCNSTAVGLSNSICKFGNCARRSCRAVGPDQVVIHFEHDLVAGVVDWCALDCCCAHHVVAPSTSCCSERVEFVLPRAGAVRYRSSGAI